MFHGLNNDFLYSAYKVTSVFTRTGNPDVAVSGTAFFLKNISDEICLVTNRHMVDVNYPQLNSKYTGYVFDRFTVRGKRHPGTSGLPNDFTEFVVKSNATILYSTIRENDIACLIKPPLEPINSDLKIVDFFLPHAVAATSKDFETKLSVCDFVAFPGFPPWHDQLNERPILRTGAIASDPRSDYAIDGKYAGQCVAYEAFSFGGSSGSPVFAVQKGPKPGYAIQFPG